MESPLPTGMLCQVQFLDGAEMCYEVDRTCSGHYLLQHIFDQIELKENIYFGLQYQQETQFKWLLSEKSLKKQLSNFSKQKRVHFYFRVKYYPPSPGRCQHEYTRYLFYLQIKLDLYTKRLPCSDSTLQQMCALALQAELGDYDPYRMTDGYVQQFRFTQETDYAFCTSVAGVHQSKFGMPAGQAEKEFLSIVTTLDYYGMNCCSARRVSSPIQIAVSHIGVCLFEKRILHEVFPWRNIIRLSSRRNKYKIVARHHRTGKKTDLEFKLVNGRICKDFWCLCRDYHAFFTGERSLIHPAFQTPSIPLKHTPSTSSNLVAHLCMSLTSPPSNDCILPYAEANAASLSSSPPRIRRSAPEPPPFMHSDSVASELGHNKLRKEINPNSELQQPNDDGRSRTNSFDKAIDRDSLTPPQNNAIVSHNSMLTSSPTITPAPPFINQYEDLDKFGQELNKKEKNFVKKKSMNDLPPPVPVRVRTGSLGVPKTELPGLNLTPFFTPNPTSHGIATNRPIRPNTPVVSKPIKATVPQSMTHQLTPLTPPGNSFRTLQLHYPANDLQKVYSNSTSELYHYSVPRYKDPPPSYKKPPYIKKSSTPNITAGVQSSTSFNKGLVEGSQFTMATRSLSLSSVSSTSSREANFEPEEYNTIPQSDTQLLQYMHDRQQSMDSECYYQTVPGREEIRMILRSDPEGRYGFNIQGKERNQDEPVIVSKVMPDSPASLAYPTPLQLGDEIVQVNRHSIQIFSHHQLVKFIKSGKDLQQEGLELLVRRRKSKSAEMLSLLQAQFPNQSQPFLSFDSSRHIHTSSANEAQLMAVSRSSVNQTPSALAPKRLPSLTLPQSIELISQCLRDGSSIDSFLAIPQQPINPSRSTLAARYPDNFKKNRYKDILPYDETRVQLTIEADYINASHVEVAINAKEKKFYLVTQGPLKHTCKDFWCMVWDQGCTLIVMLTSLKEGGKNKCYRYWPELATSEVSEKTMHCEGIEITTIEEHRETIFTRRKLRIRHQLHSGERFITQLHYTAWPDQGVPAETESFISFVNVVRRESKDTASVIHCSAGIGRSGVHIVVDVAMTMMERGLPVDLVGIIWQLRECRCNMVQNLAQYDFICRAVISAYTPPSSGNNTAHVYKV